MKKHSYYIFFVCVFSIIFSSACSLSTDFNSLQSESVFMESLAESTYKSANDLYFTSKSGAQGIRLVSENIVAYGPEPVSPSKEPVNKFGLIDVYEDFPVEPGTEYIGNSAAREYNWADYQHRLEKAHYKLKLHRNLESEVNEVVTRILQMDYVIPEIYLSEYLPPVTWTNEEILTNFIETNCSITYFDGEYEAQDTNGDSTQTPLWRIFQGRCMANLSATAPTNACEVHEFYVWLVDFSNEELIIYDMKHVLESGCGQLLPF